MKYFTFFLIVPILLAGHPSLSKTKGDEKKMKMFPIYRYSLPNSAILYVVEDRRVPVVTLMTLIRGGEFHEPAGKESLAEACAGMLRHGTEKYTSEEFSEELDFIGGLFFTHVDTDSSTIIGQFLKKDLDKGLNIMKEAILKPTFPEAELEKIKKELIAGIKYSRDNPSLLVREHFNNLLFGPGHPLGRPATESSVKSITTEDLKKFYHDYYTANRAIIGIAGDVDALDIREKIVEVFGEWRTGPAGGVMATIPRKPEGLVLRIVDKPDLTQSYIEMGYPSIKRGDPDYIPFSVLNYILGGGAFTSRLFLSIRAEEGKTYSINSSIESSEYTGLFNISTFTRSNETRKTLNSIQDELKKILQQGVTEEELKKAKGAIIKRYPLSIETGKKLLALILTAEKYNLGKDYVSRYPELIEGVTMENISEAARKYIDPEDLYIAIVGKKEDIMPLFPDVEAVQTFHYLDQIVPDRDLERLEEFLSRKVDMKKSELEEYREKILEAGGGKERYDRLKGARIKSRGKGRVEDSGSVSVFSETRLLYPDSVSASATIMAVDIGMRFKMDMCIDGEKGHISMEGKRKELEGSDVGYMKITSFLTPLFILKRLSEDLKGFEPLSGAPEDMEKYLILGYSSPEGVKSILYFSKEDYRLLKLRYVGKKMETGEVETEVEYSDFRDLDGYIIPFKKRSVEKGISEETVETEEVEINPEFAGCY